MVAHAAHRSQLLTRILHGTIGSVLLHDVGKVDPLIAVAVSVLG